MADYRCPKCGGYPNCTPEHNEEHKKNAAAREEQEKQRRGREYWRIINAVNGRKRDQGIGDKDHG